MTYQEIVRRRCLRVSETINDIICNCIQITTFLMFIKILHKTKVVDIKSILSFLILMLITNIVYDENYNGLNTLLFFLSTGFVLYFLYNQNILKSFLSAGLFMITLFLADILTSIVFINFVDVEELRSKYFIMANLSVSIITILIVIIPKINLLFQKVINIQSEKRNIEIILFLVLLICALSIIMYIVGKNFFMNEIYVLCIIGMVIFLILSLFFFKENYEKYKILNKYDQLFEYTKTFEEWIDNEKMNIHESKNQLVTLRGMVKNNKKAILYIDNIIKERINVENVNIKRLKYIPKGGLKGLLYYKIIVAENNGINMFIDATKESYAYLSKLSIDELKILCNLLGIFLDNAIEASQDTKNKLVSCEIYVSDSILNIVVSNSFSGKVELDKINNNGYSTKGKKRGKGLYLAKKVINKNSNFSIDNRIINKYFVQRIKIKKSDLT